MIIEDLLFFRDQRKKVIIPSLILVIACGCNQITTLAIDILITEALLYVFMTRRNKGIKQRVFYYFFITVAASMVCMLAPGNFYRLENGSFDSERLSETGRLLLQLPVKLFQQISANILMMKNYWLLLIIIGFLFSAMINIRSKKNILFLSAGMIQAGFFSLSLNVLLDYMPARIYAAAFVWIAFSAVLLSIAAGSLFYDFLSKSLLPVRVRSAYVFLAILVSSCSVFLLYHENHQLLLDIRSAWFYRDEQIRSVPVNQNPNREICGVPVIETNWTDIRLAEAFIANYYGLSGVEDSGVCPPFKPYSDDPAQWQ